MTTDHSAVCHAFVCSGQESTVKTRRNWSQNRTSHISFSAHVYMVLDEMGVGPRPVPHGCGVPVCFTEAVVQTHTAVNCFIHIHMLIMML